MDEDNVELGGNIQLTGFSELDKANMIVIKKIVGNYTKKIADYASHFEGLQMTLKQIHKKEGDPQYELHGKVIDKGKVITSEVTERNLFVGIDQVLKKIMAEMGAR